jgi:hypothetical protein
MGDSVRIKQPICYSIFLLKDTTLEDPFRI